MEYQIYPRGSQRPTIRAAVTDYIERSGEPLNLLPENTIEVEYNGQPSWCWTTSTTPAHGMKITINNDQFIMADDMDGAFIITKHDGRFVHAYVLPLPTKDGNWVAVGNVHWGACAKSPFD